MILDNDKVKCWGSNTYGQLGLGDTPRSGLDCGIPRAITQRPGSAHPDGTFTRWTRRLLLRPAQHLIGQARVASHVEPDRMLWQEFVGFVACWPAFDDLKLSGGAELVEQRD